jgi:hypothetical protein
MQDPAEYCRQIEAYLCKKNEGHLIRIVGPVFEQVSGWAASGVPLAIAFRGVDRYCDRYYAKGPRRRPVRIEFCEADILEEFDNWRRAVGVTALEGVGAETSEPEHGSLPSHLDRAIARLTALRSRERSTTLANRIDETVRALDRLKGTARHARGDARATLIARLNELDHELLETARSELDEGDRAALREQAERDIAPFRHRMTDEARITAVEAAFTRLLREAVGIPSLSFV